MNRVKSAVKKLIDAGMVVLPDALETLERSDYPEALVIDFIKKNPTMQIVRGEFLNKSDIGILVSKTNKQETGEVISNKIKLEIKGKVQRRTYLQNDIFINNQLINNNNLEENLTYTSKKTVIQTSLDDLQGLDGFESDLEIINTYVASNNPIGSIDDLVGLFQDRFNRLASIFRKRVDLSAITRIKDLKRTDGQISVIGMLTEKAFNTGKAGIMTIEDPSSERALQVIIPKKNYILMDEAAQILKDSVICVVGYLNKGSLISNEILLPDVPNLKKRRRANNPVHVAFLSDLHIGSTNFLSEPFANFVDYLNGNLGNRKMRALGEQTKYVLFCGDVVDGIGIYPNQISELNLHNINDQYNAFNTYIEKIPEDVQIVIIPGNHDMVRSAEPQPRIDNKYAGNLASLPNVHMLSNPSLISLSGVRTMMYHCTSILDIINNVPGLAFNKPVDAMKHILKTRHMAPMWGAKTPIAAESIDYLVIDSLPDIFHGGHMHINGEGAYRGIQIVNSGTMQEQTSFQKSLNIIPTPGQVSIINLQSFQWSRLDLLNS